MLRWDRVTVRYGDRTAVREASFSAGEGDWVMLCGPNGSGKTSLLEAAAGTIPYEGSIRLMGMESGRLRNRDRASRMAVLSQNNRVEEAFTVEETVALGLYARRRRRFDTDPEDRKRVSAVLERTGLAGMKKRRMPSLSGGETQRVFLAQVLIQQPGVLLLDEPAHSLDMRYQKAIYDLVRAWLGEGGRAVVSVEHDLDLAQAYGSRAVLIREGRILAEGPLPEVFSGENLRGTFDMDVRAWMRERKRFWTETDS